MADPYAFDVAGLRQEIAHDFATRGRNGQAWLSGATNDPAPPPLPSERYWPGWLCWLLGHEPVVRGRSTHDEARCFCGVYVVGGAALMARVGWNRRYSRLVRWLWRVLP